MRLFLSECVNNVYGLHCVWYKINAKETSAVFFSCKCHTVFHFRSSIQTVCLARVMTIVMCRYNSCANYPRIIGFTRYLHLHTFEMGNLNNILNNQYANERIVCLTWLESYLVHLNWNRIDPWENNNFAIDLTDLFIHFLF